MVTETFEAHLLFPGTINLVLTRLIVTVLTCFLLILSHVMKLGGSLFTTADAVLQQRDKNEHNVVKCARDVPPLHRGDYRTGKRLNMRKVIPYIASQFRKDKIWLRRTKPSKREYQICLAVDDSSSMVDNHSKQVREPCHVTLQEP